MQDCEHLLPSPGLAARWLALLTEIRREQDLKARGHLALSAHAWLRGLADVTVVGQGEFGRLQQVLMQERRPPTFDSTSHVHHQPH